MGKFAGAVGFVTTKEIRPGVWAEEMTERHYTGDITRCTRRTTSSQDTTIDNFELSNEISIYADMFAQSHTAYMRYVKWMGAAWTISSVQVNYPRLILTIGGVYTGQQT